MNTQPIEKPVRSPDGTLDVHSIFYTIQGEGPYCGKPAIFVRLAGCNLQCPGCDTDYTSDKLGRKRMSPAILAAAVISMKDDEYPDAPAPLIVITGGEPFRQNISPVTMTFLRLGFDVQVETNGTLPVPDDFPFGASIVCSPKTGKIQDSIAQRAIALKYVVKAGLVVPRDGLPIRALDHTCSPSVAKPPADYKGIIYIQPMDEGNPVANRRNLNAAVQSCLNHGHTLQIQTHKIAGIE